MNLDEITKYARILGNYSGERTEKHNALITEEFYETSKETALNYYLKFVDKDANNEQFVIPNYRTLEDLWEQPYIREALTL